jgi:anti-anti-sigma factor
VLTADSSIRTHVTDHKARVQVEGALDLATRDRFLAEVEASLDAEILELDLRDLEYVDSTGLSAIIQANRRSEAETGRRARLLISKDGPVRRMLELTLLHLTLDVRVA